MLVERRRLEPDVREPGCRDLSGPAGGWRRDHAFWRKACRALSLDRTPRLDIREEVARRAYGLSGLVFRPEGQGRGWGARSGLSSAPEIATALIMTQAFSPGSRASR